MSAAAKAKALAKEQGQCAVIKTLMPVSDSKRELGFPLAPGEGEAEIHEHISLLLASQGLLAMSDAQKVCNINTHIHLPRACWNDGVHELASS